jgi:hypothetical protein
MRPIRFAGVVRLANHVQRELSRPVTALRREQLRTQVTQTIELVQGTLRLHGASVRAIPGPTRRALEFLRSLDFDRVATAETTEAAQPRESVTLRGLIAAVEQIADRLAEGRLDTPEEIRRYVSRVQEYNERAGWRAEHFTPRTREHLGWLRFLCDAENLAEYRDAMRRAAAIFDVVAPADRWARPIWLHFRPTQSLVRVRVAEGRTRCVLPTPMLTFDDAGFKELARYMFGRRRRERNATLHALMLGEPFQEVQAELEALGGIVEDSRGMVHDLSDSFARVNAGCFDGQMPRPRLTWNRAITAGKFGHYNYSTDTVMISRALDRPQVPSFVVDHVMHHELLHKKHGLRWHRGRGHAHTVEFREEERRFRRFAEAADFLNRLAAGRVPSTGAAT